MQNISTNTLARAFLAPKNIVDSAIGFGGITKSVKITISVLTLGLGLGIMELIKQFPHFKHKAHEFCDAAVAIHEALKNANGEKEVYVDLNGEKIKLQETDSGVIIMDSNFNISEYKGGTFSEIKEKIWKDALENSGYYSKLLIINDGDRLSNRSLPSIPEVEEDEDDYMTFGDKCEYMTFKPAGRVSSTTEDFTIKEDHFTMKESDYATMSIPDDEVYKVPNDVQVSSKEENFTIKENDYSIMSNPEGEVYSMPNGSQFPVYVNWA